ncbi:unnamed protein product [Calypogeia fissa]
MGILGRANPSMVLSPGVKGLDDIHSSITPTRLCFAIQQTKLCSSCFNSPASQWKQPQQCLKIRRFSSKSVTTSILDVKGWRTERKSVVQARSLDDGGPFLNRSEVVELLSDAVQTLLKPENQRRLRERLEQSKQRGNQQQSQLPQEPSNVDQSSSPAPTNCLQDLEEPVEDSDTEGDTFDFTFSLQDLEEARDSAMKGDTFDLVRSPPDQISSHMTKSVTGPIATQMTELEESDGQPKAIENFQSSTESVEGKEDNSLTSIRRLKVLDVHSYVHNALRESAMRSWLNSRTIQE